MIAVKESGHPARPAIVHATLLDQLVTRHTGRAVRTSVERQIEDNGRASVLAVLDLRQVPLIDFSCADEIVAKLITSARSARPGRRFFLFEGIAEHHLEMIDSVLRRQSLAAAGVSVAGQPLLMGDTSPAAATIWQEIWALGRARASLLAARLELSPSRTGKLLGELEARALVIRDGDSYTSLGQVLLAARQRRR